MLDLSKRIGSCESMGEWRKNDTNRLYNVKLYNVRVVMIIYAIIFIYVSQNTLIPILFFAPHYT